jgi:hypothetical protein
MKHKFASLNPGTHYLGGMRCPQTHRYREIAFHVASDGQTMLIDDGSNTPVRVAAYEGMGRYANYWESGYRPCNRLGFPID